MKDGLIQLNNCAMVQHIPSSTKVKVIPRDGEIEISLDITININADGLVAVSAQQSDEPTKKRVLSDDKVDYPIPNFASGSTLSFGKEVKEET